MIFVGFGVFLVLGVLFFMKAVKDYGSDREKMDEKLDREWGCSTRVEYSDKIWQFISSFHRYHKQTDSVDQITWNDLNFSEIYQQMNHTRTSAGEAVLYHILRTPLFDDTGLLKRERLISGFQCRKKERKEMEKALISIGKTDFFSVYDYLLKIKELQPFSMLPHLLCAVLLAVGVVLLFFLPAWYLLIFFVLFVWSIFFYFHAKGKHIKDISLFQFIFQMLRGCGELSEVSFPELDEEISSIRNLTACFKKYGRFHFLVAGGGSMSGSVFDSIMDYIRILFHLDLIKISTMVHEMKKYEKELLMLFEQVGELDAMLSVASYRESMEGYAVPEFMEKGEMVFSSTGLYHPLVESPVRNDLLMRRPVLLTGSNASGKSTFLKAAAISILFAQTIHTVPAKTYRAPFYRVLSSMALRDNIMEKESYFVVEIKSLKRLFDAEKTSEIPVFCFVDEILRGTNTVERVSASSMLLEVLARKNAVCMAATHDIELCRLLEDSYENYHFEEQVKDGEIFFDYALRKGPAGSRNAILLMEGLGFDEEIIKNAKNRAEKFLADGVWRL